MHKLLFLFVLSSFSLGAMDKPHSVMPEQMIGLIEQALDKNEFSQAAHWIARFQIRVRLDAACCKDPSAIAALDMLTVRAWSNPKYQEISQHVSAQENQTIFQTQLASTKQALDNNMLPCPNWIARYGMNQFTTALETPSNPSFFARLLGRNKPADRLFVSDTECQTKQQNLLQEYNKQLLAASAQEPEPKK